MKDHNGVVKSLSQLVTLTEDATSASALGGSPGGFEPDENIDSTDSYAPGDARVPKSIFGGVLTRDGAAMKTRKGKKKKKKKVEEDEESQMDTVRSLGKVQTHNLATEGERVSSISSADTQMLEQMGYSKRGEAFYGDYELYVFEATGQIANLMDKLGLPKYQLAIQRIDTDFTNIKQQEQSNPPVGKVPVKGGMIWLKDTIELWLGKYGPFIMLSHSDAKNKTYKSVLKRLKINFTEKDVPDFAAGGDKKAVIIQ